MLYSKPCEYAIRAMTYLAGPGGSAPARGEEIARAEHLPAPILGKVLQELVRKGLLESRRGPGGGFRLARRPELITLRDVVAAIDGLDHFVECAVGLERCSEDTPCPVHHVWKGLRAQFMEHLEAVTLAEMAQNVRARKRPARRPPSTQD